MRDRLRGLLDLGDLAIASCAGVVGEVDLQPLVRSVRAVRARLEYPDEVLVVGLAGGTGSGKSSLLNALAGEEMADVGGVRPTTTTAIAVVPERWWAAMSGYLNLLGVSRRQPYRVANVCLLDLPDTDSVEIEHRHRVDEILPMLDVVVWVTDPEKYRDARLHDDYLAPLADYAEQFVFVLNQIDRLGPEELDAVLGDFRQALVASGLPHAALLATAADPIAGPPIGLETLARALEEKRALGSTLYRKLLTDLWLAVASLARAIGPAADFDERAREAMTDAVAFLEAGEIGACSRRLLDFLDDVAEDSGGITAARIRTLGAEVPGHVERVASELESDPPSRRWWRFWKRRPPEDRPTPEDLLTEAIIRPARVVMAQRALAISSVNELSLSVAELTRR